MCSGNDSEGMSVLLCGSKQGRAWQTIFAPCQGDVNKTAQLIVHVLLRQLLMVHARFRVRASQLAPAAESADLFMFFVYIAHVQASPVGS